MVKFVGAQLHVAAIKTSDIPVRYSGVTTDITDRKEAEERQGLLAREVDHRAKNTLAIVQAIISLTRADNIKQFVAAVEGRIQALARAHSLLSASRWRGANIAVLIQEELAPDRMQNFDRVRISERACRSNLPPPRRSRSRSTSSPPTRPNTGPCHRRPAASRSLGN